MDILANKIIGHFPGRCPVLLRNPILAKKTGIGQRYQKERNPYCGQITFK